MLLYYLFWMLMGFILHFYIIFGTNLLTGGPAQIAVFCLFQCFVEKEYQTESKRNETFGKVIFWNGSNPGDLECISGKQRGRHEAGGRAYPPGRALHPCGPLVAPPTYFFLLYILTYPGNIQEHHETLFPPPRPSVPKRSHPGAFSEAPPEGASITEGFYINTIASPMMCE